MTRKCAFAISLLCVLMMASPLLFMGVYPDGQSEYRQLEPFPTLRAENGVFNEGFPGQFEAWYQDHFALRREAIALYSYLNLRVFGSSDVDDVLVGSDGMLFYRDTVADYEGTSVWDEEQLRVVSRNLEYMICALDEIGVPFYVAVAPNKNSIYPERMPEAYARYAGEGNQDRLYACLRALAVEPIDLKATLTAHKEQGPLYFSTDTHFNERGAALAARQILAELAPDADAPPVEPMGSHVYREGDLARMLGLEGRLSEEAPSVYTGDLPDQVNLSEREVVLEGSGEENVLIFRDSFGVGIIPYLYDAFLQSTYRWSWPFDLTDAEEYDAVLILLAERNLTEALTAIPEIRSPRVDADLAWTEKWPAQIDVELNPGSTGLLLTVSTDRTIDPQRGRFYVSVDDQWRWVLPWAGEEEEEPAEGAPLELNLTLSVIDDAEGLRLVYRDEAGEAFAIGEPFDLEGDALEWFFEGEGYEDADGEASDEYDDLQRLRESLFE